MKQQPLMSMYPNYKRQTKNRVCLKPNHLQRTISVLCLEDQCKKDRLLCLECLFSNHLGHKNTVIQRTPMSSLSKLMMFAQLPNRQDKKRFFAAKYNSIQEIYKKLAEKISQSLVELRRKSVFEIQTFAKTLDTCTYYAMSQALKNPQVNPQYIEEEVQMIKFLQSDQRFTNIQIVQNYIARQQSQFKLIASKFEAQFLRLFQQLSLEITAISLNSGQAFIRISEQLNGQSNLEKQKTPFCRQNQAFATEIQSINCSKTSQKKNECNDKTTKIILQDIINQVKIKASNKQKFNILLKYAEQCNSLSSKDKRYYEKLFIQQNKKVQSNEQDLVKLVQIRRRRNGFQQFRFEFWNKRQSKCSIDTEEGHEQQVCRKWNCLSNEQKQIYERLNTQMRSLYKREFFRFFVRQRIKQKNGFQEIQQQK